MEKNKLIISQKPPKGEDGFRTFSIRVKDELVAQLDDIAARSGHSRNELVSMFIEFGLSNCELEE